jgi:hypothetical protein
VRVVDVVNDADVLCDPYRALDRLREDGPILWSPALGGYWLVLEADVVRKAFQTPEAFGNYPTGLPSMEGFWPRKLIPEELDGDEHVRYRRLLSPFFGPAAIRPIATSVRRRAQELVDKFVGEKECELIADLARPLPSWVFLDLFGLPTAEADKFTTWTEQLLHGSDPALRGRAGAEIVGYLINLIAQKKAAPTDDLLGVLTQADVDGRRLSNEELLDIAFLLFIAGLDTVTNQISVIVYHLARHPEQQQHLRDDPSLIPAALEELLRAYPIVPPIRNLVRDHALGGVTMKEGDRVFLAASAASRDPKLHADGDQVKLDRSTTWNTAFGLGPHRCLGVHLARQELTIVLELLATRLPAYRLKEGEPPRWHTAGNVWGLDRLPLVFETESGL